MKAMLGLVLLVSATASSATSTWARTDSAPTSHPMVESIFRVSVDGPVSPNDTFWVAYGPLAGTWGIIRLHVVGPRLFKAQVTLPHGRTVFSFIEGRGVMHTRLGAVPGNPVTTIRQVGPVIAIGPSFPPVVWHEPIG